MLVSIAIFTFVMLITTASIFTVVASNKKAESLRSVMDNLNFALESMARNIRTGSGYNCGSQSGGNCPSGANSFYFTSSQEGGIVGYYLSNGQIWEKKCKFTSDIPITATEINVSWLRFYLVGAAAKRQSSAARSHVRHRHGGNKHDQNSI